MEYAQIEDTTLYFLAELFEEEDLEEAYPEYDDQADYEF